MKLTKLQRHTAYIIMLAEAEVPSIHVHNETGWERCSTECGLCFMFSLLFGSNDFYYHRKTTLPELSEKIKYKWFPQTSKGWQKRIELLKQCIEETA